MQLMGGETSTTAERQSLHGKTTRPTAKKKLNQSQQPVQSSQTKNAITTKIRWIRISKRGRGRSRLHLGGFPKN